MNLKMIHFVEEAKPLLNTQVVPMTALEAVECNSASVEANGQEKGYSFQMVDYPYTEVVRSKVDDAFPSTDDSS